MYITSFFFDCLIDCLIDWLVWSVGCLMTSFVYSIDWFISYLDLSGNLSFHSLSSNAIESTLDLIELRALPLREIHLIGNPCCVSTSVARYYLAIVD